MFLQLPDGPTTSARLQAFLEADPVAIFEIATEVAHGGGSTPVEAVSSAALAAKGGLGTADPVRIRQAFEAVLLGRDVDAGLEWLFQIGVLHDLIPELAATVNLVQESGRMHKDVWAHTKQVVRQSVRRPLVRWAALLHDIGKVPTRTYTEAGVHFHGHAEVGARMFDKIHARFAFARDERHTIKFLVRHHLRTASYSDSWTDSAVRRFHREMGPHLVDLMDLSRADITSKRPGRRKQLLEQISLLAERAAVLAEQDAKLPPLPGGVGNAMMTAFGLTPSRLVGDLKKRLEHAIEAGELEARREDAYYVAYLARHQLVPGASEELNASLAAAGGLTGDLAAEFAAREAAGKLDGPSYQTDAWDQGDPERPQPGVLLCGHDPENDPCVGHFVDPD